MTNSQNSYKPWDIAKSFELGQEFSATAKGGKNGEVHFLVKEIDERGRATKLGVSGNTADGISAAIEQTWATNGRYSQDDPNDIILDHGTRPDSTYYNEHDTIDFDQ